MKNPNYVYHWYALKKNISAEDAIAKMILEYSDAYNMREHIADVVVIKHYKIVEEDFAPNSDLLPKKVYRNSKKVQWIRLPNGHYKKVRVVEEKPFKGLVFLNIGISEGKSNSWIFKTITSWVPGTMFLGSKDNPEVIDDHVFQQMYAPFLDQSMPDIHKYLQERDLIPSDDIKGTKKDQHSSDSKKSDEEDWSMFDVIKQDKFDELFPVQEQQPDDEDPQKLYQPGVISVNVDESVDVLTESEDDKVKSLDKVKVTKKTHHSSFSVGDQVWSNSLQTSVLIKELKEKENKASVEVEIFNRLTTIVVDISDLVQIS